MEQKLEIRNFILANTTPFFGSNFHVQTEKKKQQNKTNKKNRNACCQAIIVQAKQRTREFACLFQTFKCVGDKINYRVLSFSSAGKGNKINPLCRQYLTIIKGSGQAWDRPPQWGKGPRFARRFSILINWTEAQNGLKLDNKLFGYS